MLSERPMDWTHRYQWETLRPHGHTYPPHRWV